MDVFEEAWKNIVRPAQIKSKSNSYGPRERTINNTLIVREDLTLINRNGKHLQGFLFTSPEIQA